MMGPDEQNQLDISTQYFSTYHWQETPDGYSGFVPPRRGEIAYEMQFWPSPRSMALLNALGVQRLIDHDPKTGCNQITEPAGNAMPVSDVRVAPACVYDISHSSDNRPLLDKRLYVPSQVAAGAPFGAYFVLINRDEKPFAVKPTDRAQVEAIWGDGRHESIMFEIPLVTSSVSVVPIMLTAPPKAGDFDLRIQASDSLIGKVDAGAKVNVGSELAREVVLPASVQLVTPIREAYGRGDTITVDLNWLPFNKINAYYSDFAASGERKGRKGQQC